MILYVIQKLREGDIPIIAIIGVVLGIKAGVIAIFLAGIFAIIPSILNTLLKKIVKFPLFHFSNGIFI